MAVYTAGRAVTCPGASVHRRSPRGGAGRNTAAASRLACSGVGRTILGAATSKRPVRCPVALPGSSVLRLYPQRGSWGRRWWVGGWGWHRPLRRVPRALGSEPWVAIHGERCPLNLCLFKHAIWPLSVTDDGSCLVASACWCSEERTQALRYPKGQGCWQCYAAILWGRMAAAPLGAIPGRARRTREGLGHSCRLSLRVPLGVSNACTPPGILEGAKT